MAILILLVKWRADSKLTSRIRNLPWELLSPVERTTIFEMELVLHTLPLKRSRDFKPWISNAFDPDHSSLIDVKLQVERRKFFGVSYALPETAASVAIAASVVGAAATLLVRRTRPSEATEIPLKLCEDCGGSGICSECKGEGFVLKKLSEASAERARLTAKNMATRYTAGLPKKWSYCTKCSSARSCSTCGGSGKLSL